MKTNNTKKDVLYTITLIQPPKELHVNLVQYSQQIQEVFTLLAETENEPNTYKRSTKLQYYNQLLSNSTLNIIILAYEHNITYNELYNYTLPVPVLPVENTPEATQEPPRDILEDNAILAECTNEQLQRISLAIAENQEVIFTRNQRAIPRYDEQGQPNIVETETYNIVINPTRLQMEYMNTVQGLQTRQDIQRYYSVHCERLDLSNKNHQRHLELYFNQYPIETTIEVMRGL